MLGPPEPTAPGAWDALALFFVFACRSREVESRKGITVDVAQAVLAWHVSVCG